MKVEGQVANANYFNPIQVIKKHPVITTLAVVAIAAAGSWYFGGQVSGGQEAAPFSMIEYFKSHGINKIVYDTKEGLMGIFPFDESKLGGKFSEKFFTVLKNNNGYCHVSNDDPAYSFINIAPATYPNSEDLLEACSEGVEKLYNHLKMFV